MTLETTIYCRIELFGSLRLIHRDNVATSRFRLQKAALLLAYLALNPQRPQSRERLIDLLWPELDPDAGRKNLNTTVSALRQELEPPGVPTGAVLETDRQTVRLCSEHITTDVGEFDGLLKRAGSASVVGARARLLEQAVELYRGDLLESYYEDWALTAQATYRRRYLGALLDWAHDLETQQQWQAAQAAAERALAAEPLSEHAALVLTRAQARQGRASEAIATYRRFQLRLREQMDAEPSQELRQLIERLQHDPHALYLPSSSRRPADLAADADLAAGAGALSATSQPTHPRESDAQALLPHQAVPAFVPPTNNLPLFLNSFVGREPEMEEIRRLLAHHRLLTLMGIGGCGKTRLAVQVGNEVGECYQDGVWLVELAALTDPALVAYALAQVLDLKEQPGQSMFQTMIERLKSRNMLLILDNCEHLIGACAQLVAALLRACPRIAVLATSREAFGIAGEQTYRVPSLSLPAANEQVSLDSLQQYSAVRLFIDRVLLVKSGFTVTAENVPSLVWACQRLDGIPLAIELAAARMRVLTIEDLNRRLDDRFRLLVGGDRTALPRQQTLRALIDWSYDLLTAAEQTLLRRLCLFVGGFTLDAAEAVCSGGCVEASAVFDLVTSLVDKSLILFEEGGEETRYRMLETVRQYGQDRLSENG